MGKVKKQEFFAIYSEGLCFASVCSNLPQAEVERRMYAWPTGVAQRWKLYEGGFRTGQTNPCQCNEHPDRKHYLFSC